MNLSTRQRIARLAFWLQGPQPSALSCDTLHTPAGAERAQRSSAEGRAPPRYLVCSPRKRGSADFAPFKVCGSSNGKHSQLVNTRDWESTVRVAQTAGVAVCGLSLGHLSRRMSTIAACGSEGTRTTNSVVRATRCSSDQLRMLRPYFHRNTL